MDIETFMRAAPHLALLALCVAIMLFTERNILGGRLLKPVLLFNAATAIAGIGWSLYLLATGATERMPEIFPAALLLSTGSSLLLAADRRETVDANMK